MIFYVGQGKSTEIMNMMLNNPDDKYCYIAPYLTECHRFAGTVFDKNDSRKKPLFVDGSKIMYQYNEKDKLIEKRKSNQQILDTLTQEIKMVVKLHHCVLCYLVSTMLFQLMHYSLN